MGLAAPRAAEPAGLAGEPMLATQGGNAASEHSHPAAEVEAAGARWNPHLTLRMQQP